MKLLRNILPLLALVATAFSSQAQISTPAPSPYSKLTQIVGLTEVTIEYSRPSMRGRTIFGGLVPYDAIWRTGANAATTITFSDDVVLEGNEVEAGTYALYTMPGEASWTVMLYSDLSLGGNVAGYDEANEVVRFTVEPQELPFDVESFTFTVDELEMDGADIVMVWEKTMVSMDLEVEVDDKVMQAIETTMAGPSPNDYYQAAVYYYNTDRDMEQALAWINKTLEAGERYWVVTWKARILGKMGNTTEAIATAEHAMALAEEAGNQDYVRINQELIAEWN